MRDNGTSPGCTVQSTRTTMEKNSTCTVESIMYLINIILDKGLLMGYIRVVVIFLIRDNLIYRCGTVSMIDLVSFSTYQKHHMCSLSWFPYHWCYRAAACEDS